MKKVKLRLCAVATLFLSIAILSLFIWSCIKYNQVDDRHAGTQRFWFEVGFRIYAGVTIVTLGLSMAATIILCGRSCDRKILYDPIL